jgi:lipopolysaccharide transport system permease protein
MAPSVQAAAVGQAGRCRRAGAIARRPADKPFGLSPADRAIGDTFLCPRRSDSGGTDPTNQGEDAMTQLATPPPAHERAPAASTPAPPPPAAPLQETVIRPRRGLVGVDWAELIRHRELLGFLIWRDMKVRYKQTVLGVGWAVLQPLFFMAVFSMVALFMDIDTQGVPKPLFYLAGLLPWTFWSFGVQLASVCLVNQQHLLTKIYLPRLFIPTSAIVTGLIDMLVAFAAMLVAMVILKQPVTTDVLALPGVVALLLAATLGFGYLFSAATVVYRDLRFVVPFFIQGMMFISPLIYPLQAVPEKWRWVMNLNPLAGAINGFRSALLGTPWDLPGMAISAGSAVALLVIGVAYFRRTERRFADIA